jgi:nucleoside-diphosphate-sugar epimerase
LKILLTGAAGFTGLFFKQQAEAAGHTVWPLAANLTDKAAVAAEVAQAAPEAVVHLAAISFVGHADEAAFYAVNVLGTMNLLAAVAALPVPPTKVLLASSANVYGNCDASPITEAQAPAPVNHYATSKLAMEHMALTYADRLPIVITRPFNYTGPGQAPQFLIPKLVSHFARRASRIELGNLHVEREFNDVRMVCEAYLALLAHGAAGQVYNVCSGKPYTLQHVIDTLEQLAGHSMVVKVNPEFVRANEVNSLCGSPAKLFALCRGANVALNSPSLRETLASMLSESAERGAYQAVKC